MESDYKVPGGKLIRLRADVEGSVIKDIRITGDFFLHPEDRISGLEKDLAGKRLDRVTLQHIVESSLKGCETVGFSPEDLVEALLRLQSASS